MDLSNRHIAVLGGTTGIGLAVARLGAVRGARVTIGGRDRERLATAQEEIGAGATAVAVDATDPQQLRRFYAEAGGIDDLIITVTRRGGAGPATGLAEQDLVGAFTGKTVAHLQARELAPRRVNAVSPGVIETSWWDELPEADRRGAFETFAARTPVGRIGTADDVALAILALVENEFVTGVVLPCDGGLRLT
jgi:NAD(P)-dependent dehydrogenase (short-subunit alcohol dehydrogenase family)